MKAARTRSKEKFENKNNSGMTQDRVVEVLYQKMGDRWFAFSLIDDEVFVGSIDQNKINESASRLSDKKRIAGRS